MKKIKQEHKKYVFFLLLAIGIPSFIAFAKYLYETQYDAYLKSKKFYFYSNILTIDNKEYNIGNWDGKNYNLDIEVNNYLNNLSWTKYNIDYDVEVECPDTVTCKLNSGTSDTLVYSDNSTTTNNINISILPGESEFKKGDTLEVVVKATSKTNYRKTLSATFNFEVSSYGLSYIIEDKKNSSYATLEISNSLTTDKNITLTFDNSLVLIDTTNNLVTECIENNNYTNSNNNINSITFDIESLEEVVIKFYKENIINDYTYPIVNDISIITLTENN